MISRTQTDESLAKLGMLKYFPTRDAVVVEVARLLNELCQNDQEARQLTAAVCRQCSEWPGPGKLHELHQSGMGLNSSSTQSSMHPETARRIRATRDPEVLRILRAGTPEEFQAAMVSWESRNPGKLAA